MIKKINGELIAKKYSVKELIQEKFNNIRKNPEINAYITLCENQALLNAEKIDKKIVGGEKINLLAGIPYSVKDNILTCGVETTCASKILKGYIPSYSAFVYELLEKRESIMLGKTNMDEFGMGGSSLNSAYGKVLNPCNNGYSPGGSSGGSAASVAGDMAVFSIGSDTGGSVRQPALYCGIAGFKPSNGRISRFGLTAYASSLDTIGIMANEVEDIKLVFNNISVYDKRDFTMVKTPEKSLPQNIRVGVVSEDEEIIKVAEELSKSGIKTVKISLDDIISYSEKIYYIIACCEAASNLGRYDGIGYGFCPDNYENHQDMVLKTRSEGFGDEVKARIIMGNHILSDERVLLENAQNLREEIKSRLKEVFKNVDVIILPVKTGGAVKYGEEQGKSGDERYNVLANLSGSPAISIPVGKNKNGMPVGIGIMADRFCDELLLEFAEKLEELIRGEK